MELVVDVAPRTTRAVEVVERKRAGHPDTLCDAIAERVSLALCRAYRERCGAILHHDVDKVLLVGGAAAPAFGGGVVREPIEIYVAGRATSSFAGVEIPVAEIAEAACREVLRETVPLVDRDRDVRIFPRLRGGSADLTALFARARGGASPLANDTSFGAGFAPLADLERAVLAADAALSAAAATNAAIGADGKIMGVRAGGRIELTVACAIVGRHVASAADYERQRETVRAIVLAGARAATALEVDAHVNVADDVARGEMFLTVTGTSAESGDDGEVGRGNRASGLITPYRWMTLEATAGKNPVTHVGKLYAVVATRIAERIVKDLRGAEGASCLVLGQIGRPIDDPRIVHVELATALAAPPAPPPARADVDALVRAELAALPALTEAILAGSQLLF